MTRIGIIAVGTIMAGIITAVIGIKPTSGASVTGRRFSLGETLE